MRLVGYIRVSTDEQDNSLQIQRDKIVMYCELYGHEVVGIEVDDGYSAKDMNRPGLQVALSRLGKDADGLIVAKLDRLTRSLVDMNSMIQEYFRTYTLLSQCDQIDTSTASGNLVLNILMSVSQWERETISERTKNTAKHYKSSGKRWGGIPYGKKLDEDGTTLIDNPLEMEVIEFVKEHKWESQRKIARLLNETGYVNRRGGKFMQTQIKHIQDSLKENI